MSATPVPQTRRPALVVRILTAIPWTELVGLALVLAGGFALFWWSEYLHSWQLVLGAGVLLFLLAGSWRRIWGWLLGPVLFHDLVRSSRQGRQALLRCLYLMLLLVVLFLLYWEFLGARDPYQFWIGGQMKRTDVANFTEAFFFVFVSVQFCVAFLLTPIFTAGCVAEEKDRKTLEFLLTTDLGNHEIIFGKMISRLAALLLLIITGLPVLGILQFLGGVDPNLVLGSFAATGVTVLSLACLGVANSVFFTKPRTAILMTYIEVAVYLALSGLTEWIFDPISNTTGGNPFDPLLVPPEAFGAGNIFVALHRLFELSQNANVMWSGIGPPPSPTGGLTAGLFRVLLSYSVFHALVILICLLIAILPLRALSRWEAGARGRRSFVLASKQRRLPRVWNNPLLWKEMFAEPLFRFNRSGLVIVGTFVTCCLIFGAFCLLSAFVVGATMGELPETMNQAVRLLGTFIIGLLLVGIAIRSAGSISAERDRLTLESLLTTPAENGDILGAKWLGSVLCGRKLYWYIGVIWLAGLLTGGLHPLGLILLLLACLSHAIFVAGLGLWFSLISRTTTRAYIWTLLTVVLLCCSHWILGVFLGPFVSISGSRHDIGDWVELESATMVPPYTLYCLALSEEEVAQLGVSQSLGMSLHAYGRGSWRNYDSSPQSARVSAAVLGVAGYAAAGVILWGMTALLFGPMTGRVSGDLGQPRSAGRGNTGGLTPRRSPDAAPTRSLET